MTRYIFGLGVILSLTACNTPTAPAYVDLLPEAPNETIIYKPRPDPAPVDSFYFCRRGCQ